MTQSYSDAIALKRDEGGVFHGQIDRSWYQGRGAFGGVSGAAMVRAMERTLDAPEFALRALAVNFCAPVTDEPFEVHVDVVRRGSSVICAESRIVQEGQARMVAIGTFAKERSSGSDFEQRAMPEVPPAGEVPTAPESPLFPKFAKYYEYKFCHGAIPYTGHDEAELGGWCRLKEAPGPLDAAQLIGLLDMWPPAVITRMTSPAPAATVSWQVVINERLPLEEASADDFYLVTARSERAVGGFSEERAAVYSADGRCLGQALQLVAIFGG
ncbi:thioesterase family protein [Lujinxingia vulgaris]|uniref:Thioesterase family protein n=1 Tax=Lujinxingia vulgaris TaxID=2600176 RepID=A0A5C6XDT7_9DELT|nr:thioesterase family protein [Lujinxingia vulgaris]TXD37485.1 thioesterase family protein [Lujinxingia vulgaris]